MTLSLNGGVERHVAIRVMDATSVESLTLQAMQR